MGDRERRGAMKRPRPYGVRDPRGPGGGPGCSRYDSGSGRPEPTPGARPDYVPWENAKLGPVITAGQVSDVENLWMIWSPVKCPHGIQPSFGWTILRQFAEYAVTDLKWPTFGYLVHDVDIPEFLRQEQICMDYWLGASLTTLWCMMTL